MHRNLIVPREVIQIQIIFKSQLYPKEGRALTIKNLIISLKHLVYIPMLLINIENLKLQKMHYLMKEIVAIL